MDIQPAQLPKKIACAVASSSEFAAIDPSISLIEMGEGREC
jgi:hypothetical protein